MFLRVYVEFRDERLRRLCEDRKKLTRRFGSDTGRRVQTRIADLRAARDLAQFKLIVSKTHPLSGDRDGQIAIPVSGSHRLVAEPCQDDADLADWATVDAVRLLEIVDYH